MNARSPKLCDREEDRGFREGMERTKMQLSSPSRMDTDSDGFEHEFEPPRPVATNELYSRPSSSRSVDSFDGNRMNPFEKHLLEHLQRPLWSPSVMAEASAETPPQMTWGIDQMSLLNPKRIEDSPSTHQNEKALTPQTEAKAQHAISRFFSEHMVIPSPPTPVGMTVENNGAMSENSESQTESPGSKLTNTDFSLPPILPPEIEQLLLSLSNPDPTYALSNSVKRRKLDFTFSASPGSAIGIEEHMEMNHNGPNSGSVVYSPGVENAELMSPRQFREGFRDDFDSPRITPIKVSRRKT